MDKFYHLASSIKQHCYRVAHAFTTPKVCNYLAPFFPHSLQNVKSLLFRYFSILFLELSQPLKGFTSMTACISIHRNTHTHTHTHTHTRTHRVHRRLFSERKKFWSLWSFVTIWFIQCYSTEPIYIYFFLMSPILRTLYLSLNG